MKTYKVRAFTQEDGSGGNTAGVVLDGQKYSSDEKQEIAKKLGFSETAFLSQSPGQIDELEFYTPNKKIPLCGHATVATFGMLSKKLKDGVYPVRMVGEVQSVQVKGNKIGLKQSISFVREVPDYKSVLKDAFSNISDTAIKTVSWVNNGVSFFVLEIESWEQLIALVPEQQAIKKISDEFNLIGFYLYAKASPTVFYTRMFGPRYGIPEESATGMGAGCMMAHLNRLDGINSITIVQGLGMNPPIPSLIEAQVDKQDVWVFGRYKGELDY